MCFLRHEGIYLQITYWTLGNVLTLSHKVLLLGNTNANCWENEVNPVAVGLFVFIAWVVISVYFFVPIQLSTLDNLILFFVFTIISMNIFTIIDLNLNLIQHSNKKEMFVSFWIHRNIVIPLILTIFVNFTDSFKSKVYKLIVSVSVFSILLLINLLAFRVGLMTCGSNLYLGSAILIMVAMLLAFITMKLVTKLPEGESM